MRPPGFIIDSVFHPGQFQRAIPKILHHFSVISPRQPSTVAARIVQTARASTTSPRALIESITKGLFQSVKSAPRSLRTLHHGPPTCIHSQIARQGSSKIPRSTQFGRSGSSLHHSSGLRPGVGGPRPIGLTGRVGTGGSVGLSPVRQFSSTRGVFENVVQNVPLGLRALMNNGEPWDGTLDGRKWRAVRNEIRKAEKLACRLGTTGEKGRMGRMQGVSMGKKEEFETYFDLVSRPVEGLGEVEIARGITNEVDLQVGESVKAWLDTLIWEDLASSHEESSDSGGDSDIYSDYSLDSFASSSLLNLDESFGSSSFSFSLDPGPGSRPLQTQVYDSTTDLDLHDSIVNTFLLPSPPRSTSLGSELGLTQWPLCSDWALLLLDLEGLGEGQDGNLGVARSLELEEDRETMDMSWTEWETVSKEERIAC